LGYVIPAQAGNQCRDLDSRLRGNDGEAQLHDGEPQFQVVEPQFQALTQEIAALQRMTVKELRAKFADVCGDETRSGNRAWLIKRIAWRMQANHEGGLSERARQRARELACHADLRLSAPRMRTQPASAPQPLSLPEDSRLPLPGTILVREYTGAMDLKIAAIAVARDCVLLTKRGAIPLCGVVASPVQPEGLAENSRWQAPPPPDRLANVNQP
jgi:hypothetical protein